jgi:hypothetical protein
MKKKWVAGLVIVAVLIVATGVYATGGFGPCGGPGRGAGFGPGKQVDVTAFRNFQKETLPLRDEMAAKRLEMRNEYANETPDQNKIAALQEEMVDLRTKIQAAAEKNGLPGPGFGRGLGGGRGPGAGFGPGQGGRGGCGGPGGCPGVR